jgi:hypothetical protein
MGKDRIYSMKNKKNEMEIFALSYVWLVVVIIINSQIVLIIVFNNWGERPHIRPLHLVLLY